MLSRMPLEVGAFVAVDLETTGSLPGRNSIIEVGAARVEAGRVLDVFRGFVRPKDALPAAVSHLTGITSQMLADAAPIAEVLTELREFVGGAVVIAHDHRFDLGFLDHEAEQLWGESLPRPVLDTLAIARRLHPDLTHLNLRRLAQIYGAPAPSHRALDDAIATANVFVGMLPRLRELGLRTAGDVAAFCGMRLQSRLASKLMLAHDAPDSPGVFLFRDDEGQVIFVDRARNVRARVRSHFYSRSDEAMIAPALDAAAIDCIECASELDAVLLESRLLERYAPVHNRSGERGEQISALAVQADATFPALEVLTVAPVSEWAVGPFTNRWAAETLADALRVEYGLRRCVVEMADGAPLEPCPFREERSCPRPCVNAISEDVYRERLASAMDVFDGSAEELRGRLEAERARAVEESRRGDAARCRDALRALDRCLSSVGVVKAEIARPPSAIIEGNADTVVIHLIVGGVRRAVLRLPLAAIASDAHVPRLRQALCRLAAEERITDPLRLSRRQLKDLFLLRAYRETRSPMEMRLPEDCHEALADIEAVLDGYQEANDTVREAV